MAGVVLIAVGRHLGGDACGIFHGVALHIKVGFRRQLCARERSGETAIEAHIAEHVDGGGAQLSIHRTSRAVELAFFHQYLGTIVDDAIIGECAVVGILPYSQLGERIVE